MGSWNHSSHKKRIHWPRIVNTNVTDGLPGDPYEESGHQQWWCYRSSVGLYWLQHKRMMTSSNGNIFRVTGRLCGEFTGPGEFPSQRPVTRSLVFSLICVWINDWVNNSEAGNLRRSRAHYDVTLMGVKSVRLSTACRLNTRVNRIKSRNGLR